MFRRSLVYALCLAILNLGSPLVAHASLVGTLPAVESNTRAANLATVNGALAKAEVREQMAALGVSPADIDARVARLTDTELNTLAGQMQQMPAGCEVLAIIGIVFLVLLILEAVGVTDIFKKFP